MSPINRNKQVRLDDELYARVERLMVSSGLTASDIIRLAMIAGIPRLESGEINPFSSERTAEEPPEYGREKRELDLAAGDVSTSVLLPMKEKRNPRSSTK